MLHESDLITTPTKPMKIVPKRSLQVKHSSLNHQFNEETRCQKCDRKVQGDKVDKSKAKWFNSSHNLASFNDHTSRMIKLCSKIHFCPLVLQTMLTQG